MDNNRPNMYHTSVDFEDIFAQQNRRSTVLKNSTGPAPERRRTIGSMYPSSSFLGTRVRNLSGGSSGSTASGSSSSDGSLTQLDNQTSDPHSSFPMDLSLFPNSTAIPASSRSASQSSHRKLDRSWSDTDSENRHGSHKSVNTSRYKTELCRPFEESGSCKYGDKCQFAHGYHELRNLVRHPKYKTELCRTFHTVGFCPYGPRCHFVHEDESKPADSPKLGRAGSVYSASDASSPSLSPSGSEEVNVFSFQAPEAKAQVGRSPNNVNNQVNGCAADTFGSNSSYDIQALERHFATLKLNYSSINNNNIYNSRVNSNQKPKLIGCEERDIFSEVTMFNSEEVLLDNASLQLSSSCAVQSMKVDNFSFVDLHTPSHWPSSSSFGDY